MLQSGLYVGLSGQLALQRRLDAVANNVANSATAGFRAEEITFESLISRNASEPVAFASSGETFISRRAGETVPTGNPLDIAVQGDAWLAVQTPGGTAYSRDGRMRMMPTGELQTMTGNPIVDESGAPLILSPTGGPPQISQDGRIMQNGKQMGRIGLFTIDPGARLTRADNASVIPDRPAQPVVDFSATGVVQGFVERANVNSVLEMTNLITLTRSFDAVTKAMTDGETSLRDAIQALGAPAR
ncbi:MAG: flagellar basal-body rod protein FlgF [Hyphomicrobium sp.]